MVAAHWTHAELPQTPFERLARLNKHRNVAVTVVQGEDFIIAEQQAQAARDNPTRRNVIFSEHNEEIFETTDDEDYDESSVVSSQPSSPIAQSPKGRPDAPAKMGFFSVKHLHLLRYLYGMTDLYLSSEIAETRVLEKEG